MALADIFTPSGTQTQEEAQANLDRQQALLQQRLAARQAAGTISAEDIEAHKYDSPEPTLDSEDLAAAQGLAEGAQEGFQNVLKAPGKVVGFAGDSAGTLLGGILKNIPWWVYLGAVGVLFFYMGGAVLLRGSLKRFA